MHQPAQCMRKGKVHSVAVTQHAACMLAKQPFAVAASRSYPRTALLSPAVHLADDNRRAMTGGADDRGGQDGAAVAVPAGGVPRGH